MADYILSIDQGTTSSRAIVFGKNMQICGVGQKELTLYYPHNGWVEQDAEAIWTDTLAVCHLAIKEAGITASDVAGIGITNQRETIVVWDKKTGKPLNNAIVWQDRRTADYCSELKEAGHEKTISQKTGLLLDPYFSATKLGWILDNVPNAREQAENNEILAGTIDCFLLWHLTGGNAHLTDATNASRTMLFNVITHEWDKELLELFNIPSNILPEVCDNSHAFGHTADGLFDKSIPITAMAGDQQAALFGQACFDVGMMKTTYGTGCFALMNIGTEFKESKNRLLTTIAYRLEGQTYYAVEGSVFIAGAAIQWLRDGLNIIDHASETQKYAESIDNTNGVYLVPAFTGLGAPYWNSDARGTITGLTRDTGRAHIVRAALEAQAYQTQDLMGAMSDDTGKQPVQMRVDGGMVANDWMCQFLSDMTDIEVDRPTIIETTALGVAYLAALHLGFYTSLDDIKKSWQCDKKFIPDMADEKRQSFYSGWKNAVEKTIL